MRKSNLLLALGIVLSISTQALPAQYAFRISFTDKWGTAAIHQPLSFLSQRALDRRAKYNILVDSTDLPVSTIYIDSVKKISSAVLHSTSRWLNYCVLLMDDSSTVASIRSQSFVKNVEWVGYFPSGLHNKNSATEANTLPASQLSLRNNDPLAKPSANAAYYNFAWDQINIFNGACLHDLGWKGQNMLIAVFDNGFKWVDVGPAFDSLYHSGRIVDGYNFVKDTTDVYNAGSHGTEVLSILAGYLPNHFVGTAPMAQYALYVTEDVFSEQPIEMDNLIAGMERADSIGVDVMSMSVGYNGFDAPFSAISSSQLDGKTIIATQAANAAVRKGIFTTITAGNEGSGGLLSPSDADSALTVGNVDINKQPASSSGHGPNAAGVIKPNVCGLGNPGATMTFNMNVSSMSGTSFSTPAVAGMVACLLQGNPTRTPYQLRSAIQQTGHTFATPGVQTGYGVPDFCAANLILGISNPTVAPSTTALYPNPFESDIRIEHTSTGHEMATITLSDIQEKTHLSHHQMLHVGKNSWTLSIPATFPSGIYLIRITTSKETHVLKAMKR